MIVAGNGIGSPRLLLMSASAQHPRGLANGNDMVGRHLLHHTRVAAEIWVDKPIRSYMGNSGALISSEFAETDIARGFVNGFNFNVTRTGPTGAAAVGAFGHRPTPWGAAHHDHFARHFGYSFGACAIGDDLPQPDNRVTVSDTETDSDGHPDRGAGHRQRSRKQRVRIVGRDLVLRRLAEHAQDPGMREQHHQQPGRGRGFARQGADDVVHGIHAEFPATQPPRLKDAEQAGVLHRSHHFGGHRPRRIGRRRMVPQQRRQSSRPLQINLGRRCQRCRSVCESR